MNETLIIAKWLLVFTVTSLVGSLMFVSEDSKMLRYTVGKALGVICLAAISWVLSLIGIVPFTGVSLWLTLIIMFGITLYFRHSYIVNFLKNNYHQIIIVESIVLVLFVIFLSIRLTAPKIEGIEKFMDVAILASLIRHKTGIPVDTWFATNDINYYYFGHWIIATWSKLSSVSANYAFNLGFASILSTVGAMIYAIVHRLSSRKLFGFIGIFLALFASNIYAFIYFGNNLSGNIEFYKSGRFVDEIINEYPLYSVILGDLHAHMIGLLLSVALFGLVVITATKRHQISKYKNIDFIIIGGLLGLMAVTNSFDIINCGVLLAMYFMWLLLIKRYSLYKLFLNAMFVAVPFGALLIISSLTFKPAVSGIQIAMFKTPLIHIFWQFGVPLALIAVSLLATLTQPKPLEFAKKYVNSFRFVAVLFIASAIALILLTEIFYVKDIYHFANPPYARANTQFKIWYGAWILLAIGATALFGQALNYIKQRNRRIFLVFAGSFLVAIAGIGTLAGFSYFINQNTASLRTLDGTAYISQNDPDKLLVINYVQQNIAGQPIILQNGGDSYSQNSWLASYTGTAAYLGWKSHEWGWRYSDNAWNIISARDVQIKQAYEANSASSLTRQLQNIGAKYLLLGPDETNTYTVNKDVIVEALGQPIFKAGAYELYKAK